MKILPFRVMTENEYEAQEEKWKKFLAKHNCNHHYVFLATKEYDERLKFFGITPESPDSLKGKASALPVFEVEIGQDHCTPTFYAKFFRGNNALGEVFTYPKQCNFFRNGFETPDVAYEYILGKASKCNASWSKDEKFAVEKC